MPTRCLTKVQEGYSLFWFLDWKYEEVLGLKKVIGIVIAVIGMGLYSYFQYLYVDCLLIFGPYMRLDCIMV
jgi:hypothetical protein